MASSAGLRTRSLVRAWATMSMLRSVWVTRLRIKRLDLVRDTTIVEVCFKLADTLPGSDLPAGHPGFSGAVPNR